MAICQRSFRQAAASVWNNLPLGLRKVFGLCKAISIQSLKLTFSTRRTHDHVTSDPMIRLRRHMKRHETNSSSSSFIY